MSRDHGRTRWRGRAGGGVSYDPDAQAYFTAVGLSDTAYTNPINSAIVALKANSLWSSKVVRLWLTGNKDEISSLTCWKSLATMTPVNDPTHSPGRYYTGNGSTSYLNTNFNASTDGGGVYTQNSGARVTFVRNNRTTDATTAVCGVINGGFNIGGQLIPRFDSGKTWSNINSSFAAHQINAVVSSGTRGLWTEVRSDSTTMRLDLDGAQVGIHANAASTILLNLPHFLLARNVNGSPQLFSTDQVFLHGYFGALDAVESAALATIVNDLVSALGA